MKPRKQFVFSGQYATINNEWCQPELIYSRKTTEATLSIWHTTTQKRNLVKSTLNHRLHNLNATRYCLQTAYQKKENITREQASTAFANFDFPANF